MRQLAIGLCSLFFFSFSLSASSFFGNANFRRFLCLHLHCEVSQKLCLIGKKKNVSGGCPPKEGRAGTRQCRGKSGRPRKQIARLTAASRHRCHRLRRSVFINCKPRKCLTSSAQCQRCCRQAHPSADLRL